MNQMTKTKKESFTKNLGQVFPTDVIFASTKNSSLVEGKHQQIVDGACKIFFKKGFHPTTIREIAKACGMSMGQLYHYISSKDDVLYLVHKHMQRVWYNYLRKSDIDRISDPLQKISEALQHTLQFMIENKKLIQFIYTESKYLDKKHRQAVMQMDYNNVIGFWRSLLQELYHLGDVSKQKPLKGDIDILASAISYLLVFLPLRGWTVENKPTNKVTDWLAEFILRGSGLI